jgi:hypothetical protein
MSVLAATAKKTPVVGFTVTDCQAWSLGKARWVHVIPSVEEAAIEPQVIATKTPVVGLKATEIQFALTGMARWVHVIPSDDEAATDDLMPVEPETAIYMGCWAAGIKAMETEGAGVGAKATETEGAGVGAKATETEGAGAMGWSLSVRQSRNVWRHSSMVLTSGAAGARAGALDFLNS